MQGFAAEVDASSAPNEFQGVSMTHKYFCGLVFTGCLVGVTPMHAHHSFAATFDRDKPITVKATISEVRWENPHSLIYVEVKDQKGHIEKWTFESYPPSVLYRKGLRQNRLKPGAEVTLKGFRARNTPNFAEVSVIEFPDGESFCVPASGSTPICDANER
jgi:Family of unknown function (DUF6152)